MDQYRKRPPRRRTAPRPARAPARQDDAKRGSAPASDRLRIVVCGLIFIALIGCKLALPGGLADVRGRLSAWLVRDADIVSAFSAVGRAAAGEEDVREALAEAREAMLGRAEAVEVSGAAELPELPEVPEEPAEPELTDAGDWPERVSPVPRALGFDCAAPLEGTVTSPFGWRSHPVSGREAFHYGVDVAAEEGTEIVCFADGIVGVVGDSVELGKYLTVRHDGGLLTLYAHCSRIAVDSGDTVSMGQKLAEVGSTGNATGPHLHFELHDGEETLDPTCCFS